MAHDHRVAGAVAHPGSHRTQRADFPHCARQKLTHSTAIACSSAYGRYSFGRNSGYRSVI